MSKTLFQHNGDLTAEAHNHWLSYLGVWKKFMTVYNSPTHLNNFAANPFLMQSAGLNSYEISSGITKAGTQLYKARQFRNLEDKHLLNTLTPNEKVEYTKLEKDLKYYLEAQEEGLLNTSVVEDLNSGTTQSVIKKGAYEKIDKKLTDLYQGGDSISKLAMFTYLRKQGWTKTDARNGALSIMPNYSAPMPMIYRKLRDSGISPFIAWTYYTLPKMAKLASSPRGLFGVAKGVGGIYMLSYLSTGIANPYSDKLPDDYHMARVPISKKGDEVTTVKMDRINPYMQWMNPKKAGLEMMGSGLLQTIFSLGAGVKLYNGRPITNENKPTIQQWYDKGKYASGLVPIPGQIRNAGGFIEGLVRDEKIGKLMATLFHVPLGKIYFYR